VPRSVNPPRRNGRGVPDVAANASPETGYRIPIGARGRVVGGTSAVSPLWAGLVARLNEAVGSSIGYINPLLYQRAAPRGCFRDVTDGNNGAYAAAAGWDACSGLGVAIGDRLSIGPQASAPRGLVEALKTVDGVQDPEQPIQADDAERPTVGPWAPAARDDG